MEVLLVEDDDVMARLVTRTLESRLRARVTRAGSVAEAGRASDETRFDVAILDYLLPDGDGLAVLERLRQSHPGVPVLFLTGHGSEKVALQALSRGAADYVVKGGDFHKDLATRVTAVLERFAGTEPLVGVVARAPAAGPSAPRRGAARPGARTLVEALGGLVGGDVEGAGLFDAHGRPIEARLPPGVDAKNLGAAASRVQGQMNDSVRRIPGVRAVAHALVVEAEGHLLAVTTLPGPSLLVLLLHPGTDTGIAMARVRVAAERVTPFSGR